MRETRCAVALAALMAITLSGAAEARTVCGERDSIIEKLRQTYDESRRIEAVTGAGTLMEIFVSPVGTWTILITAPGGPTCLVSSGEGWQPISQAGGDA